MALTLHLAEREREKEKEKEKDRERESVSEKEAPRLIEERGKVGSAEAVLGNTVRIRCLGEGCSFVKMSP